MQEYIAKKILDKAKSGPSLNIGYLYKQIEYENLLLFVKKNKKYFKKFLPVFFNKKLSHFILNFDKKDMDILFGLVNFVIWCKLNIDNSIKKANINLEELIKIDTLFEIKLNNFYYMQKNQYIGLHFKRWWLL